MERNNLIIVEKDIILSKIVCQYFQTHFSFNNICVFSSFSSLEEIFKNRSIILVNAEILEDTQELISMSKAISSDNIPVVIYSSMDEPALNHILDAIELGAIDVIPLSIFSNLNISSSELNVFNEFINSLIKCNYKLDMNLLRMRLSPNTFETVKKFRKKTDSIVVIGCDIGATSSILALIPQIPKSFPAPICVLINTAERFLDTIADRLEVNSNLSVKKIEKDTVVEPATVYLISTNKSPVMESYPSGETKILVRGSLPFELSLKHSINKFMFTTLDIFGQKTIGILLGGVQEDGILGLSEIKRRKGVTILQSEKSCLTLHRLKKAIKSDCAEDIVYIADLPEKIINLA